MQDSELRRKERRHGLSSLVASLEAMTWVTAGTATSGLMRAREDATRRIAMESGICRIGCADHECSVGTQFGRM